MDTEITWGAAPRPKQMGRLTGQEGGGTGYQEPKNEETGLKRGIPRIRLWEAENRKERDAKIAHGRDKCSRSCGQARSGSPTLPSWGALAGSWLPLCPSFPSVQVGLSYPHG